MKNSKEMRHIDARKTFKRYRYINEENGQAYHFSTIKKLNKFKEKEFPNDTYTVLDLWTGALVH